MTSYLYNSCDFAIVYDCKGGRQQYIKFNKAQNSYYWEYQPAGYNLDRKIEEIKSEGLWNQVKETYLYKKQANNNKDKKSRALFAETINRSITRTSISNCNRQSWAYPHKSTQLSLQNPHFLPVCNVSI